LPWESLEHTSDLALLIRGQSEEELFTDAAAAVLAQIVEPDSVAGGIRRSLHITAENPQERFLDWMRELLFLATSKGFLPAKVVDLVLRTETGDYNLDAELEGEILDTTRHLLLHEVKTVTYQDFFYGKTSESWQVRVVLDV